MSLFSVILGGVWLLRKLGPGTGPYVGPVSPVGPVGPTKDFGTIKLNLS